MEGQGWTCSSCQTGQADSFCTCTGVATLFCEACFFKHYQAYKWKQHPSYPVSALSSYSSPGYMDRLQARTNDFPCLREHVMKSISEVDKCETELTVRTQETVAALTQYCGAMVEWLRGKKAEMYAALGEVEATMLEERPALQTTYGQVIRDRLEMRATDVTLFAYTLPELKFESLMLLDIEDQPDSLKYLKTFPSIAGNVLTLFDIASKQRNAYRLATTFTPGTTFCLVDVNTLLCVGADPPSDSVFSLNLYSTVLTQLPNMKYSRAYSSLAKVGSYVYVFGGKYPDPLPCEKYSLSRGTWNTCPILLNQGYVACAVHLHEIYLISHADILSVSVFNTRQETIRTLSGSPNPSQPYRLGAPQQSSQLPPPLRISRQTRFTPLLRQGSSPAQFQSQQSMFPAHKHAQRLAQEPFPRGPTWAFIVENELFLLSCTDVFLTHFTLNAPTNPQFHQINYAGLPLQNCPAFAKNKECILSDSAGNMVTLDIDTCVITKH